MQHPNTNPFEDESAAYRVLINAERQYSLWPDLAAIPAGWESVLGAGSRAECLNFITANWTDLRPARLIDDVQGSAGTGAPFTMPRCETVGDNTEVDAWMSD